MEQAPADAATQSRGPEFRIVGPNDEAILADIFREIDTSFFRPHSFSQGAARRIAGHVGQDAYALLIAGGQAVAYGMLRGWDEGYPIPNLGVGVRTSAQGRGFGRLMMAYLHAEAKRRESALVRLRVHPQNLIARRLYESLGYRYAGEDRGELVMLVDLGEGGRPVGEAEDAPRVLQGRLLDVGAPEWEAVLRTSRHDFYHLPAYVALCAAESGGRPCALFVTGSGRAMLLPLIISDIPGGGLDALSPYGYPGPIGEGTEDAEFLRLALAVGREALHEAGIVAAFVRFHPLLNVSPPRGVGTVVRHGETVSIDLAPPQEQLWAQMSRIHRRNITRCLKLGYTARIDDEWTHLEAFKRLYRGTMDRRQAESFYFFTDTYFEGLQAALGDRLHLSVVERGGEVVAAGLFVETNGIVECHLSGSDASFKYSPAKLMFHFMLRWAKERGNAVFHLGGGVGGVDDSLMDFKAGFAPGRASFHTLRLVLDESAYRRLVVARDGTLNPELRHGYFPAYRAP